MTVADRQKKQTKIAPTLFSPSGDKERLSEELEYFARNYTKQRRRMALKLINPRIKLISLRTFRHWKATIGYFRTVPKTQVTCYG